MKFIDQNGKRVLRAVRDIFLGWFLERGHPAVRCNDFQISSVDTTICLMLSFLFILLLLLLLYFYLCLTSSS